MPCRSSNSGTSPSPIIGIDLQWFGIIVATGLLIGAGIMRRYGERHGIDDDDLRGMTAWVCIAGFAGAHWFDVLFYQNDATARDPWLIVEFWKGISSYGGFIGGALGWVVFQWWKRLQTGLWADITVVGLLPAFSIGRIGCTLVSDHVGAPTSNPIGWDYPINEVRSRLCSEDLSKCPSWLQAAIRNHVTEIRLWNLGFVELSYLALVNVIVLGLAFQKTKRLKAGFVAALTGALYAPVRFVLEYLRPDQTDPRYIELTFAQWASITALVASIGLMVRILTHAEPAPLAKDLDPKYIGGRRDRVLAPTAAERREREEKRRHGLRRWL